MPPVDAPLHAAVSELYQHHHGWLQGWLHRRLDCHEQAADLAQDTFTRLLGSRRVLDAREPRAYLTTIAKGLMINWFQRQSLERAYLEALAGLPEELAPSPEQRYLVLETLHEIDALLARLPDPVRQAFLLSQIEGLKYEAIAQRLGVSLGSVKRYMQQAFRHCLELME
ncbi:MAG: sigma-70 family RNA polymerase sigma factor [Pseudomonas sp.]|uniref:sigma-70 family RNA polymerase sigma factor n=1 Tax=Pseudomonas nitroreducens TaxID=46680 RepID=UPI002D810890|nr:sigma-70 family RNA polymerase sigma factor [Pseudomonas nitroreducens]